MVKVACWLLLIASRLFHLVRVLIFSARYQKHFIKTVGNSMGSKNRRAGGCPSAQADRISPAPIRNQRRSQMTYRSII